MDLDMGNVSSGGRTLPDGKKLSWKVTSPVKRADELAPFVIEWSPESLSSHPSTTSPKGCTLIKIRFEHPHPENFTHVMNRIFGVSSGSIEVKVSQRPLLIATLQTPRGIINLVGNGRKDDQIFGQLEFKRAYTFEEVQWMNSIYDSIKFESCNWDDIESKKEIGYNTYLNSRRIGMGRLKPRLRSDGTMDYELGGIYVVPELRKHGFARQIVNHLLDIPREKGSALYCLPFNHLKDFYCSFGFKEIDTEDSKIPSSLKSKLCECKKTFPEVGAILLRYEKN